MKSFIITVVSILCLSGLAIAQEKEKEYVQLSDPIEETGEYQVFGSAFNSDIQTVAFDKLIEQSGEFDKETVSTEGTIMQVCLKKGCFFMLESDSKTARISFKDYGFFVPTNTAGSRVKVNGTFSIDTISEADAKHYAEDAGEDPDALTGPQKEYSLVATSVMIYK